MIQKQSTLVDICDLTPNKIFVFVATFRSRKTGSMTMVSYFASGFVYAKVANLVLFFRADPRLGLVYLLLFILQGMLLPEPTYKGTQKSKRNVETAFSEYMLPVSYST